MSTVVIAVMFSSKKSVVVSQNVVHFLEPADDLEIVAEPDTELGAVIRIRLFAEGPPEPTRDMTAFLGLARPGQQ